MESASRDVTGFWKGLELQTRKPSVSTLDVFGQFFSLSRLFSITWQNEAAPNSEFCMFWVNLCPETVSKAQFQITWRQGIWSIVGHVTALVQSARRGEEQGRVGWTHSTAIA